MIRGSDCLECPAARSSAFACLTPTQYMDLRRAAIPHTYLRGQTIFYEGNPALAVF